METQIHNKIKNKVAEAFTELGYDAKTEVVVKDGRLDVLAVKGDEELKVEIINTHCPDWILVKVLGYKSPKTIPKGKKIMLTFGEKTYNKLKVDAEENGISIQELLRSVILPRYYD